MRATRQIGRILRAPGPYGGEDMDRFTAAHVRSTGPYGALASRSAPLLAGRTLEQIFLREELAAVLGGHGRLVLLGGEAGIGKTTLARDLADEATARGARVFSGACYDLTNTPPYGPWLELFEACTRDHDLPPPGRLRQRTVGTVSDQAALYAEVRAFFAAIADRPTVLLLEDLHWADPASLELLRHLAPRLRHWPVLLLVTYRGDELTRRHPFAVQLPALVREAEGLRLDLQRLDVDCPARPRRRSLPPFRRRRDVPGRLLGPARRGQPILCDRTPPRVAGGSTAAPRRRWLDA